MSELFARVPLKEHLSTEGLLSAIEAFVATDRPLAPEPVGINALLKAAAVLHLFNSQTLVPMGDAGDVDRQGLESVSVPAIGYTALAFRSLTIEVRRQALAELGSREAFAEALSRNPDREMTKIQHLFETWLDGRLELNALSYSELEALRAVAEWKLDRFGEFPSDIAIEVARARRASVSLFDHIVDRSFVGRDNELQILRDYVGVVSPSLWSKVRAFLNPGPQPPLVVTGAGGVGKTALVGRFLLEHVQAPEQGWFPFVYLPFDAATIDVREPWTLLTVACEQLASQIVPDLESDGIAAIDSHQKSVDAAVGAFRAAVSQYQDSRSRNISRTASIESQSVRLGLADDFASQLYARFGQMLSALSQRSAMRQRAKEVPVLMVLDTFEEVVYRTNEDLENLWRMLTAVQLEFPALRVVIAGRIKPRPFTVGGQSPQELEVGELAEADAQIMLSRLGVEEPDARTAIIRQVGRSPLTLKLAAKAAKVEPVDASGLTGLKTSTLALAPELIRGHLYRRILDHIHDSDVRCLAHPGMTLRRITPDLIENVLAPLLASEVGSLRGLDANRTADLFENLRREHTIVRLDDDLSLRFREEVRTPMLQLLSADKPKLVEKIHRAAADYYQLQAPDQGLPAAAELLYHKMMLGTPAHELEGYWSEGLERYLGTAVEEIPDEAKIWLASHMSIELPPDVYERADLLEWERIIGGKVQEALRYSSPSDVLYLLEGRVDRSAESPLYPLEIRARMSLGPQDPAQSRRALDIARQAIAGWPMRNPGRLAEIYWLGAQCARALDEQETARAMLRDLIHLSDRLDSSLPRVQALTELILLTEDVDRDLARVDLATSLEQLTPPEVDDERALVRLSCVRLGPDHPSTIAKLLPSIFWDLFSPSFGDPAPYVAAIPDVLGALATETDPRWMALRDELLRMSASPVALSESVRLLEEMLSLASANPTDAGIRAALVILAAEKGDLHASGLAGVDQYREGFELRSSAEAAA